MAAVLYQREGTVCALAIPLGLLGLPRKCQNFRGR